MYIYIYCFVHIIILFLLFEAKTKTLKYATELNSDIEIHGRRVGKVIKISEQLVNKKDNIKEDACIDFIKSVDEIEKKHKVCNQ